MAFDDFDDDANPYAAPKTGKFTDRDEESESIEYASFFTRFAAAFLDGIITNILSLAIGFTSGLILVAANIDPTEPAIQALFNIIGVLVVWFYCAGFNSSSYQATPGKMAVGIKVTDINGRRIGFGRASGRFIAKLPSALLLMIGYLMQPFTQKKQALHDIMAGTIVIKK